MNANKFKAVLFIIIFLIVVALIVYILTGTSNEEKYQIFEGTVPTTQVGEEMQTPEVSQAPATPQASEVIATPEITPEPTPEPTPTPMPAGIEIANGEIKSESGTLLNTIAKYSAVTTDDTHVTINISVDLEHYALYTVAGKTLNIAVNGNYQTVNVEAISYDGANQTKTTLGSIAVPVEIASGQTLQIPIQIEWHFGGTYGGKEVNIIESGGYITLER